MKYLNIVLVLFAIVFPVQSFSSKLKSANYSVSTIFDGVIGKSKVTMYLTTTNNVVAGKYIYNKYGNEIFINGSNNGNSFVLREKLNKGSASITLTKNTEKYTGTWCNDKCLPVNMNSFTTFRNGPIKKITSELNDNGEYSIDIISVKEEINISGKNAIDNPDIVFSDINNDGIYDLIVVTDRRPNNGTQDVYLASDDGYIKDEYLSSENGTLVFNPFAHLVVFNSKEDCCDKYQKIVYELHDGKLIKADTLTYDYSKSVGINKSGINVSKSEFEKY